MIAHAVSSFGLHRDDNHSSDELATIDFNDTANAIASMFTPIEWLANSSFRPGWSPTANLSHAPSNDSQRKKRGDP